MPERVLLEEYHLTMTVAPSLADDVRQAIRDRLNTGSFRRALERAVRTVVRGIADGHRVRIEVTN
jgi:ribosomal protein S3